MEPVKNQDLWKQTLKLMDDCADMGIILDINLIENNEKREFHDRAKQLAITALTGDYGSYVSDAYMKKQQFGLQQSLFYMSTL